MPNPIKVFIPNTLVFVSCRTEEGLPFVPVKFINEIIYSAMGRAYELYPVTICSYLFEANHFHMLFVVKDPETISPFIGYLKQEMTHGLNRLLGRKKKTIWCDGFDSPVILDSQNALEKFAYVLLNPVKDQLVSSMEQYPGVSSYSNLINDDHKIVSKRIYRDSISPLRDPERPWLEEYSYRFDLDGRESEQSFELSPYAWKSCFNDTRHLSDEEVRAKMLAVIREREEERKLPKTDRDPVALTRQSILQPYTPTNCGRRMYCHAKCKELRKSFIATVKMLREEAKAILVRWRSGEYVPFTPGLFAPSFPRLQNLNRRVVIA